MVKGPGLFDAWNEYDSSKVEKNWPKEKVENYNALTNSGQLPIPR